MAVAFPWLVVLVTDDKPSKSPMLVLNRMFTLGRYLLGYIVVVSWLLEFLVRSAVIVDRSLM